MKFINNQILSYSRYRLFSFNYNIQLYWTYLYLKSTKLVIRNKFSPRLVGNKSDDDAQLEVIEELAKDFAEEERLYLFHTSAKDDMNVKQVSQKYVCKSQDITSRYLKI